MLDKMISKKTFKLCIQLLNSNIDLTHRQTWNNSYFSYWCDALFNLYLTINYPTKYQPIRLTIMTTKQNIKALLLFLSSYIFVYIVVFLIKIRWRIWVYTKIRFDLSWWDVCIIWTFLIKKKFFMNELTIWSI